MEPIKRHSPLVRLTLWDAVSIILGIIIGVGIFESPHLIFQKVPHASWAMAAWFLGGLFALAGALCFAELGSTYPRSGGEYTYLTRAFGPLAGYLFAWAQLTVIRPGGIGALAYIFAFYAQRLWNLDAGLILWLAAGAVLLLTAVNVLGVTLGKHTQNLLTAAKLTGILAIIVAGFGWGDGAASPIEPTPPEEGWFATAMILVLWSYAGWHEAGYIASEVEKPQRTLPMALILGTAVVTVLYVFVNMALVAALGFDGARNPGAVAQVVDNVLPRFGARAVCILVMISSLGALNGMIFTTARIYSEFGADHRLFQPLAHWSRRMGTPVRALLVQCSISLGLVLGIELIGNGRDDFEQMIAVTASVFWGFFLLTGIALFRLRALDGDLPRPFRVPFYPWLPLAFCVCCACMVYGAIRYQPMLSALSLLVLAAGVPFYYWKLRPRRRRAPVEEPEPVGTP